MQLAHCVSFKQDYDSVQKCFARKEFVSSLKDMNVMELAFSCYVSEPFPVQRLEGSEVSRVFPGTPSATLLAPMFYDCSVYLRVYSSHQTQNSTLPSRYIEPRFFVHTQRHSIELCVTSLLSKIISD